MLQERGEVQDLSGSKDGSVIDGAFVKQKRQQLKMEEKNFARQKEENAAILRRDSDKRPGELSDPAPEADRIVRDILVEKQRRKIIAMERAIVAVQQRQLIVTESGEISRRKFGDVILGYKTEFPDTDGSLIQEELNIILVPSALVESKPFKVEMSGTEVEFVSISPASTMGKSIVEASL